MVYHETKRAGQETPSVAVDNTKIVFQVPLGLAWYYCSLSVQGKKYVQFKPMNVNTGSSHMNVIMADDGMVQWMQENGLSDVSKMKRKDYKKLPTLYDHLLYAKDNRGRYYKASVLQLVLSSCNFQVNTVKVLNYRTGRIQIEWCNLSIEQLHAEQQFLETEAANLRHQLQQNHLQEDEEAHAPHYPVAAASTFRDAVVVTGNLGVFAGKSRHVRKNPAGVRGRSLKARKNAAPARSNRNKRVKELQAPPEDQPSKPVEPMDFSEDEENADASQVVLADQENLGKRNRILKTKRQSSVQRPSGDELKNMDFNHYNAMEFGSEPLPKRPCHKSKKGTSTSRSHPEGRHIVHMRMQDERDENQSQGSSSARKTSIRKQPARTDRQNSLVGCNNVPDVHENIASSFGQLRNPKMPETSGKDREVQNLLQNVPRNTRLEKAVVIDLDQEAELDGNADEREDSEQEATGADNEDVFVGDVDRAQAVNVPKQVVHRSTLATRQQELKKALLRTVVQNKYPEEVQKHAHHRNLVLEEDCQKMLVTGQWSHDHETVCVLCSKATSPYGETDLLSCEGKMVGEMGNKKKKRCCLSRMHVTCAKEYNASGATMNYSLLPECQNKILCPLHFCSTCSSQHLKQAAYEEELINCALCLRSFHRKTCFPAGGKNLEVKFTDGGEGYQVSMLVCPSHAEGTVPTKHLGVCDYSGKKNTLRSCRTCPKSFRFEERKVLTVDGEMPPADQCQECIDQTPIRVNTPVWVVIRGKPIRLGFTRSWESSTAADQHQTVGFVPVEVEGDLSVVSIAEIVPLNENNIKKETIRRQKELKEVLSGYNIRTILPPVCKTVSQHLRRTRVPKGLKIKYVDGAVENCEDDVIDESECNRLCKGKNGEGCKNRAISEGTLHKNMKLEKVGRKGFGVVAVNGPIKKNEVIGEYSGELIDLEERLRREAVKEASKDQQAAHYTMLLVDGLSVDATRMGNSTRYINHSCSPNAQAYQVCVPVECKRDGKGNETWRYHHRLVIRALRDIQVGEELTIDYTECFASNMPVCYCGADNCTGSLIRSKK